MAGDGEDARQVDRDRDEHEAAQRRRRARFGDEFSQPSVACAFTAAILSPRGGRR
jgi:hypothetical protein